MHPGDAGDRHPRLRDRLEWRSGLLGAALVGPRLAPVPARLAAAEVAGAADPTSAATRGPVAPPARSAAAPVAPVPLLTGVQPGLFTTPGSSARGRSFREGPVSPGGGRFPRSRGPADRPSVGRLALRGVAQALVPGARPTCTVTMSHGKRVSALFAAAAKSGVEHAPVDGCDPLR